MRLGLTHLGFPRKRIVVLLAVVAAGIGCATAVALWSDSGSGSGTVSAESIAEVTLSPGTPTTSLFPGTTGDVAVSIVNDNTYRAYVGSLVLDTSQGSNGFSVTGGQPGCDPTALTFTSQSNAGAGWFVPAGSTLDLDLPNAIALDTSAASECQGATFVVYLLAST